jgi:hypothetical protein
MHAIRLTYAYHGDDIQFMSWQRVGMVVPLSDPVQGYEGQQGCRCELHDAQGRTIFRRLLPNPIRWDVEAPGRCTRPPDDAPEG